MNALASPLPVALVPCPRARPGGASNVTFTRMDEIQNGVKVADADGNVVGVSKAAGKLAVMQTVVTRNCGLPVLPIIVPAIILKMAGIESAQPGAEWVPGRGGPA